MGITIISRYKNKTGKVYKYDIADNTGNIRSITPEKLIELRNNVINAVYVESIGTFRGKHGCHIKTIVDNKYLLPTLPVYKNNTVNNDIQFNMDDKNIINNSTIGKEYIKHCRLIRDKASRGQIRIDKSEHSSNKGYNTHLFELIETTGLTVEQYITGYLSRIQPYQLAKFNEKKSNKLNTSSVRHNNFLWVMDTEYKIALIIKLEDLGTNQPIVVSFHESNIQGNLQVDTRTIKDTDKCVLLYDDIDKNSKMVKACIQRGFINYDNWLKYESIDEKHNIAIVQYKYIKDSIIDSVYDELTDLWETYDLNVDENNKNRNIVNKKLLSIKDFEFVSYGHNVVNELMMLIDIYPRISNLKQRLKLTNIIITGILDELDEKERKVIKNALISRNMNTK